MSKYRPTQINKILNINPGEWFIANVIGLGIYEMVESGINHVGDKYAIVKCKKIFGKGFTDKDHETTCHPISIEKWNSLKIVKRAAK